ncbi:hypothetical protein BJY01DRAFT_206759 [Aspergillus pseudoustus]|uniref:Uncharacterized protein n=1 Tax=Aspergillus pseudoustus TaxID=1810923 RepID=A0ABR4KMH4_9EURO
MPLFRKHSPTSQSSSENNSGHSRSLFSRKSCTSTTTSISQSTKTHQASLAPEPKPPAHLHPRSTTTRRAETQFLWEDIDPPAEYLNQIDSSSSYLYHHAPPPSRSSIGSTTQGSHTASYQSVTMLNQSQPRFPSVHSHSSLPGYNDVSGAVVVDVDGCPRFLSPQEEVDRKATLQRAVQERMMGLPRTTDFSWEASGSPVLPKYEPATAAEKTVSGPRC